MGLVESGVGLIPAGGGCKEMLLRSLACGPAGARGDEAAMQKCSGFSDAGALLQRARLQARDPAHDFF